MSAATDNKNDLGLNGQAAQDGQAGEEEFAKQDRHHQDVITMPEELQAMSEEEIADLRKKMVRKMDCVIM